MIIGGFTCAFSTLYASFWMGKRTTTVDVKFPFVQEKSDEEFWFNFALQWIIFINGLFLYFGIEITMNLFEDFAKISPKVIHLEFIDTMKKCEQKELYDEQLRITFKNGIMLVTDYQRYFDFKKSMGNLY